MKIFCMKYNIGSWRLGIFEKYELKCGEYLENNRFNVRVYFSVFNYIILCLVSLK